MLKEGSTNWAEGWKNKTWKEVFKYEGGREGWKNKMLKELGRVGKNAGGGLEKCGRRVEKKDRVGKKRWEG